MTDIAPHELFNVSTLVHRTVTCVWEDCRRFYLQMPKPPNTCIQFIVKNEIKFIMRLMKICTFTVYTFYSKITTFLSYSFMITILNLGVFIIIFVLSLERFYSQKFGVWFKSSCKRFGEDLLGFPRNWEYTIELECMKNNLFNFIHRLTFCFSTGKNYKECSNKTGNRIDC